jgi:hypothetical protein
VLHETSDIAQVYGAGNLQPIVIQPVALSTSERYFVVCWGLDDAWGEPTEEPYVKEIKVTAPIGSDPPLEPGMALVEVMAGQRDEFFKPSESGSPVFNMFGQAVGIMIRGWVDATSGLATRGIVLPFVTVAKWLDGVREAPVNEPVTATLPDAVFGDAELKKILPSFTGGCVFLGKYSAQNLEPNGVSVLEHAPIGVPYLKRVISFFPEEVPSRVSDENAVLVKQLPEPELLPILPGVVNIRAHCPNVVTKPKRAKAWERNAYYSPVIAQLRSPMRIHIKLVQRQAYLEDFFYWGVVESISPL